MKFTLAETSWRDGNVTALKARYAAHEQPRCSSETRCATGQIETVRDRAASTKTPHLHVPEGEPGLESCAICAVRVAFVEYTGTWEESE